MRNVMSVPFLDITANHDACLYAITFSQMILSCKCPEHHRPLDTPDHGFGQKVSLHAEPPKGSTFFCFQTPILKQRKVMAYLVADVGAHTGAKWEPKGCCNFSTFENGPSKTNKNGTPRKIYTG